MPMKPWPDEVIVSPWMWTSMSSQWANSSAMIFAETGSLAGEVLDRLVGEDDAPAERDAGRVALEHIDLVRRVAQLHRDGEIEAGRPAADAGDLHANAPEVAKVGSDTCAQARAREGITACSNAASKVQAAVGPHRRSMPQPRACRTVGCRSRKADASDALRRSATASRGRSSE